MKIIRWTLGILTFGLLLLAQDGCSSSSVKKDEDNAPASSPSSGPATPSPSPSPVASLPPLAYLPHPEGMDMADLEIIFKDPLAPEPEVFLKDCDAPFLKLKESVRSHEELIQGVNELVDSSAAVAHWCFYGKLWDLETRLGKYSFLDEKQKAVLDTFSYLAPVARAFLKEYKDSRYLRWAIQKYEKYSEMFFLRKLEMTPSGTSELVEAVNPFDQWRKPKDLFPILEKYKIQPQTTVIPAKSDPIDKELDTVLSAEP